MDDAHVKITVSGDTYNLIVDPVTYSEVDIVDFSPRAIAGTPAFSELGLYLDVSQIGFGHGFGEEIFGEPKSYAYSGQLVDTRHDFISLFTNPVTDINAEAGFQINNIVYHRDTMVMATNQGARVRKTDLSWYEAISGAGEHRDILSNGRYLFLTRGGRMRVCDLGDVGSATSNTLTAATDPLWTTDVFTKTATVIIYEGTGAGSTGTVTANTTDTITISGTWATTPDATSKFFVYGNAGVDGNPPNNFKKLAMFGGYTWGVESILPYAHFWAELDGTDAEGGQDTDTAAVRVGPGDVGVNNMIPFNNQLWVMRQDGAWAVGDDNLAYHMIDVSDQIHADNFEAVAVWNGFMWFNVRNTLYKYRSGLQDVTPPIWDKHLPYKRFGDFQTIVPRGKFLYVVGKSNAANSTDESQETSGFMVVMATDGVGWHKLFDGLGGNPDNSGLYLDPLNDYLYASFRLSGATTLYRFTLQETSDLPYASYPTTGDHNLYTSYYDLGHKRITKSYASVALEGDFPSGATVDVYFRLDSTAGWTSLGTVSSSLTEVDFPANTTGKRVQLKLNLQTTNSANTPVIRAAIIKQMMRPDVLYGVSFEAIVMDNLATPHGLALPHTADELRAALKAARDSKSPITFVDIHGSSASAYISSVRFILVEQDEAVVNEVAKVTVVYV